MNKWIDVEDRLPEFGPHIVCLKSKSVMEANFSPIPHAYWFKIGVDKIHPDNPVTHWMPLPEPPNAK
jgi:hypothetical protein